MFSVISTDTALHSMTAHFMENYFSIDFVFSIHLIISMTSCGSCTLNRANRNFQDLLCYKHSFAYITMLASAVISEKS